MNKILILCFLAASICLEASLVDYLMVDMKGREGVCFQGYKYSPHDARDAIGNRLDDYQFSLYWYHFNTSRSSIEFGTGLWDETSNGLRSTIRPITIGISFYENMESNYKFFYGADIGAFRLETQLRDNLGKISSYSETDPGLQLKLGIAYLLSPDYWIKGEIRYTGCTINNIFPTGSSDSNISDFNFAGSLSCFF